jgi:Beta-galactosidase
MKKTIHRFCFLMILVLCVVITSCRTTNIVSSAGRYASVPLEGIPILAWYGVQEHTVERYRELKECGFDYNLTLYMNVEQLPQALDAAKEAGIRMIIYCEGLETELENTVNRFKDHPAIGGYYLKDEPNSNEFPHLGELVRRVQSIDNQHFCYVNIFPDVSSTYLKTENYLEYVQLFLKIVPVEILSFDQYPISVNASGVRFLYYKWYQTLKIISDEARNAGKPFWAFALTTAHAVYPIPTIADLKLQIYSSLAYGAQGIQYFTYWTPPNPEFGDFHDGPISDYSMGQRSTTWYNVKQMNEEIKRLSNVFLGAQVIKVEHITTDASGGNGNLPIATTRFDFANRPAEAKIIKKFDIPNNTNAFVSFLKNGNRCYMVIVNRNLEGGDNVTFTITGGAGLQLIKKDGKAVNAFFQSSKQTVTPGDALIYGWNIK